MSLRYMQLFIPDGDDEKATSLLEGLEVLSVWRDDSMKDRVALNLLVTASESEPIMDRFEEEYRDEKGFKVLLMPVEAALPRIEEEEAETESNEDGETPEEESDIDCSTRVSREELYNNVNDTLGIDRVFLAMCVLSTIVAAVGLLRNDVAVIIGAMVIAPLLGPNVGMSLSATLGDFKLLRKAAITNIIGVSLTLSISILIGYLFDADLDSPAIASRTRFGIGDLALALAAGAAGTFAFTRGFSDAVIGVMVAVALMPPLVVFGMMVGNGKLMLGLGALFLVLGNVVCINLAGIATFLAQGVRPRSLFEEDRAQRARIIAISIWVVLLITLATIIFFTDPFGKSISTTQ